MRHSTLKRHPESSKHIASGSRAAVCYLHFASSACGSIGAYGSRLWAIERFWRHKEQADLRVRRYGTMVKPTETAGLPHVEV